MGAFSFAFMSPWLLMGLAALPTIWWLLRLTPPRPRTEVFPPLRILATVLKREETPSKSPWWLTLLRMMLAAVVILALADPVMNPRNGNLSSGGPLVLVVDNSWAAQPDWERRVLTVSELIDDAGRDDRPVSIVFTADSVNDAVPGTAAVAREKLAAAAPRPLRPERERAAENITIALNGSRPGTLVLVSDGVEADGDEAAMAALAGLEPAEFRILGGDGNNIVAITAAGNGADAMTMNVSRLKTDAPLQMQIEAMDSQGRSIASGQVSFRPSENTASSQIQAPFELRNDFARLAMSGISTAGSVHLLDDGFRRRRVALLTGDSSNDFQPLLQPLYYISRALQPYADLIEQREPDLAIAIPQLLEQNPSVIVMADIGRLPADTYEPLQQWIADGGTLIRFAGPRLAAAPADDPLVPVVLRQGERTLGGAMSWAEPQRLADFPAWGAFAGMQRAADVVVNRQVLAQPAPDLAERTWASLADGTPLVTMRDTGAGRIVLFHVSAEATWSDLPISGHFVEMLRRLVQLSKAGGASTQTTGAPQTLPPWRLLAADGSMTSETGQAKPLAVRPGEKPASAMDNPPGLYGNEDGFTALNLLPEGSAIRPFDTTLAGMAVTLGGLAGGEAKSLRPALFIIAFILLALDSLIMLFMNGAFARKLRPERVAATVAAMLAASLLVMSPDGARAEDGKPGDETIFERLDTTHLAYVITGEAEVDRISEQGLAGLTEFLTWRTTLEPGAPVGLDISKDELSFYPIIYWPVSATAPMPSAAAISRIDAYMRAGGTVLFDTRDQVSSLGDNGTTGPNGERLQAILANIDIPPLEPTPQDHVLTRSFYLLTNFPGRYNGSPLWVESRQEARTLASGITSSGDGVTPIMITANDFAGAWAIDAQGSPVLPIVPPDEVQREHAFRSGVNIMMYMLTGNYKADQVHVPALLERLGQ